MHFIAGNRITLLESGTEYFPALLAAIAAARTEVHLESYIFANDDTGRRVAHGLIDAVRRGVNVRVLVDGFGARNFAATLGAELDAAGADVMVYRPEVARLRVRRHRLRRLHRKVAVVDGEVAFVGGINVLNDTDDNQRLRPRFDFAVRIEGPLCIAVHASTTHLWALVRWARLRRRIRGTAQPPLIAQSRGDTHAALVIRDNLRHRRDIEDAYLDAIGNARNEIIIAIAYFLPGRRFRHALLEARARGVRVLVMLQGRAEYVLFHYATQAMCEELLRGGVELFEYQPGFMHAKVAVIDSTWATVGSSNIDPFSLLVAREANIVVRDARFAATLRKSLLDAIANDATEVRADDWRRSSLPARVFRWIAYGLVRALVGVAGYGGDE